MADILGRLGYGLTRLSYQGRKAESLAIIKNVMAQRTLVATSSEAWFLSSLARSAMKIPGNYAEVGTYQGASAAIIAESAPGRPLHVFDTFEGIPEPRSFERTWTFMRRGAYAASYEEVRTFLAKWPAIWIHKGLFPDTAIGLESERFAFVHLDVDIYESTLACLKWFYPRLSPGGIIISHDYNILIGVARAFEEFFSDKPEPVLELTTNQCMIVKSGPIT